MDSNIKPKILVDAVITWVDGSDKDLLKKKSEYLSSEKESKIQIVKNRYNQVGEIEFVIKSIIKFAPFINNIFIVTDGQSPKIIDDSNSWRKEYRDKLKVVDHKVIFRDFQNFFQHLIVQQLKQCCITFQICQNILFISMMICF
tara:strand:+ start:391 stop:822 length:432 start_codon:yes stop_codon:yes gene_type:complete